MAEYVCTACTWAMHERCDDLACWCNAGDHDGPVLTTAYPADLDAGDLPTEIVLAPDDLQPWGKRPD